MKLLGRDKLVCLKNAGEQVEKWLCSWLSEIMNAHWRQASDVLDQFPRAKINEDGCFEFCVGNQTTWIICLHIAFSRHVVIIQDVKG